MYKDRPKIKLKEHSFQFNCYFVYIFLRLSNDYWDSHRQNFLDASIITD